MWNERHSQSWQRPSSAAERDARLKIFYICHRFPFPPHSGAKVRAFNMIRHLSSQGHDVTVASLARSASEADEGAGLARYCAHYELVRLWEPVQLARIALFSPTSTPSSMAYFYSSALARRIELLFKRQRFDLIFVHCSSVAHYVTGVRGVPKILDFCDMDSQKWLAFARFKSMPISLGYRMEGLKLQREEKRLASLFDVCTVATPAELQTLQSYGLGVATDWFPNGVDSDYFAPTSDPYDGDTLSFIGRMDYYPNQQCMFDFCANVLPRLQERRPRTKLFIVGADPSPKVKKLADLPGVTVTGSVPDVRPYVRRSAVMVAPLNIARGTQNKILEAMAMGVPVVTSPTCAGGVDAVPGEHLLVARSHEEQAQAILRLLDDRAERQRLSLAGRARMVSHHGWSKSMRRLDGIIERSIPQHALS